MMRFTSIPISSQCLAPADAGEHEQAEKRQRSDYIGPCRRAARLQCSIFFPAVATLCTLQVYAPILSENLPMRKVSIPPNTVMQDSRLSAAKYQTECICVNLRRAARAVSQLYDIALAASGLKITQFSLLRAIERNTLKQNRRASINLLAEEMELDRSTLARNLRPLERDGLVTLSPGRDKRVVEANLTTAGIAAIAHALPLWRHAQRAAIAGLGTQRMMHLCEIAAHAVTL